MNAATMPQANNISIASPDIRRAGRDLLSLALMDARNHTLYLLSHYEQALGASQFKVPLRPELNPPLWELGHIGWFQEWWLGRNLQRHLGRRGDPFATRLASIEPQADRWWDSGQVAHDSRWGLDLPDLAHIKTYLLNTLESTLELLEKAPDEDEALYFYRLALFHEDMHGEALIYMGQTLGLPLGLSMPGPGPVREPLLVPATRWQLGSGEGGFTFDNERQAHEGAGPEFEIDAQVVGWARCGGFVGAGRHGRQPDAHRDGSRCQPRCCLQPLWLQRAQESLHLRCARYRADDPQPRLWPDLGPVGLAADPVHDEGWDGSGRADARAGDEGPHHHFRQPLCPEGQP